MTIVTGMRELCEELERSWRGPCAVVKEHNEVAGRPQYAPIIKANILITKIMQACWLPIYLPRSVGNGVNLILDAGGLICKDDSR